MPVNSPNVSQKVSDKPRLDPKLSVAVAYYFSRKMFRVRHPMLPIFFFVLYLQGNGEISACRIRRDQAGKLARGVESPVLREW